MPKNCTSDANNCIHCPAIEASPGSPARDVTTLIFGYNAGANSIDVLDGNIRVRSVELPAGVAGVFLGFRSDRALPFLPYLIEHGWHFISSGGEDFAYIVELGNYPGDNASRGPTDLFEIRRVGSVVSYYVNDGLFYVSPTPSVGPKLVNSVMYASGDSIE